MERSTNYFPGSSVGRHQDLIVIRKRKVNPFASFLHVMWYVFWTMTEATEQIYLSTTGAATSSNPIIEGTLPCRQHCRSDEGGASVVVFFVLFCCCSTPLRIMVQSERASDSTVRGIQLNARQIDGDVEPTVLNRDTLGVTWIVTIKPTVVTHLVV